MKYDKPYAIAMWDFSWLERRWPGAGYEDWDEALDGLVERGYNAVRIEAYPHLMWIDPEHEWILKPVWNQQCWGAPAEVRVKIQPNLNLFLRKCAERSVKVALSTWFRKDINDSYRIIKEPEDLARMWKAALDTIDRDLLEYILWIDICNELPIKLYTPFLPENCDRNRSHEYLQNWMRLSTEKLRGYYPHMEYTFSTAFLDTLEDEDASYLDFLEPHIWMSSGEFYGKVGYNYETFDPSGYEKVVKFAEKIYRENPAYWRNDLKRKIEYAARCSREKGKLLMTTECWGITDYKDWPGLDWEWVRELCELGTIEAAGTGRWMAIATSNFCGPQFHGMWRDVQWHKKLTDLIKRSKIHEV